MPATSVAVGLDHVVDKVESLVDAPHKRAMRFAGGMEAKKVGITTLRAAVGFDQGMSGWKRGKLNPMPVRLNVGWDDAPGMADAVVINFRPGNLWRVLDEGRKARGTIRPKPRGGKKAVKTPKGPAASSPLRPSRGKGTLDTSVRVMRVAAPKAAYEEFQRGARRVFGL